MRHGVEDQGTLHAIMHTDVEGGQSARNGRQSQLPSFEAEDFVLVLFKGIEHRLDELLLPVVMLVAKTDAAVFLGVDVSALQEGIEAALHDPPLLFAPTRHYLSSGLIGNTFCAPNALISIACVAKALFFFDIASQSVPGP